MGTTHSKADVRSYVSKVTGGKTTTIVVEDEASAIKNRTAMQGHRGANGVNGYGEDAQTSYPLYGGGWKVSDHDKDFIKKRTDAYHAQKNEEAKQAKSFAEGQTGGAPAPHEETKAEEVARMRKEINERSRLADKTLKEWNADNDRRAKAKILLSLKTTTIMGKDLQSFSEKVVKFTDDLRGALRQYPKEKQFLELAKAAHDAFARMFNSFDRQFQAGLKIAGGMIKILQTPAGAASVESGGVDPTEVVREMMDALHKGQTSAISGRGALSQDNDFAGAYSDSVLAHMAFVTAANAEARFSDALITGANRIVDLLHEIETDCESAMNFVDAAVTGGKIAAIFPTVVDLVEAKASDLMGQEHKSYIEIGIGGFIDVLFFKLDGKIKDPITDGLKKDIEKSVFQLSKGVIKEITKDQIYTISTQTIKTSLKALASEYFDIHKKSNEPIHWDKVAEEIYKKWQQDFITDQASRIAGLKKPASPSH